ncbi:MAG: hypothetical protein KAX49_02995 [Halanaerobiales bacterium]|nr:hypothetical protein [Halanaerobiales bacterium]
MNQIEKRLLKVFQENLSGREIEESTLMDTDLVDLDINSLNFIKIVVALEEEFDIEFEDSQLNFELFGKVSKLMALIEEKINEQ